MCTFVSLRDSRLFLVCDNRKREEKEKEGELSRLQKCCCPHFKSIKKAKRRRRKRNQLTYFLSRSIFLSHSRVNRFCFSATCLSNKNQSYLINQSINQSIPYRVQFYISFFVNHPAIMNVKFSDPTKRVRKVWNRNSFHFDFHNESEEDRGMSHELY